MFISIIFKTFTSSKETKFISKHFSQVINEVMKMNDSKVKTKYIWIGKVNEITPNMNKAKHV